MQAGGPVLHDAGCLLRHVQQGQLQHDDAPTCIVIFPKYLCYSVLIVSFFNFGSFLSVSDQHPGNEDGVSAICSVMHDAIDAHAALDDALVDGAAAGLRREARDGRSGAVRAEGAADRCVNLADLLKHHDEVRDQALIKFQSFLLVASSTTMGASELLTPHKTSDDLSILKNRPSCEVDYGLRLRSGRHRPMCPHVSACTLVA